MSSSSARSIVPSYLSFAYRGQCLGVRIARLSDMTLNVPHRSPESYWLNISHITHAKLRFLTVAPTAPGP
jgi:hypothetical protein